MLIDWFTVGAQVLNFLVLVWLMKKFLYKPILSAIDAREKHIASQLADADTVKSQAEKERDNFQEKNQTFDKERGDLIKKAQEDAKAESSKLSEEARKAAETLLSKQQESWRKSAEDLDSSLRSRTQQEVFSIARKALSDLADSGLELSVSKVFMKHLREMDDPAKQKMSEALNTSTEPALVRSAFDLPEEQRSEIQKALNEAFSREVHVQYVTAPELVSGIEFATNGQKVAWNISNYLSTLQKSLKEILPEKAGSPAASIEKKATKQATPQAPEQSPQPSPKAA